MTNPFLLALQRRDRLSPEEVLIVESLSRKTRTVPARSDLVVQGDSPRESSLLLAGAAARYNIIGDGKRQISALHFAGDFVDLHSLLLQSMDHSVLALTDCQVAGVPHEILREISTTHPHLTRLLWLFTVIDAAIFRQWLVAAGRRSVQAQLAHLLCEVWTRLEIVDLVDGYTFQLPLSQTDLSDAMGLSLVHVNRTIQAMKRQRLVDWTGQVVRILNWPNLQKLAEFDPDYLQLQPAPR